MREQNPTGGPRWRRAIDRVVDVRDDELVACLWAAGYFFFLLSGYFLLRPLREAMGLEGGVDYLSTLFLMTVVAMLALQPVYGLLTSRLPRRRFVPIAYRAAMVCLAVFSAVLFGGDRLTNEWTGYVFFVWLSVFNLFAVSVFWSVMADSFSLEQSKRLFGFLAMGGTLGAIAGSWLAERLANNEVHPGVYMLISIALLECAVRSFVVFDRSSTCAPWGGARRQSALRTNAFAGLVELARSRYLLTVCGYIGLLAVVGTFWYFTKAGLVERAFETREARTAFFARVEFWAQAATLLAQLFLTGRLMRLLGVGVAMAALPVLFFAGFALLYLSELNFVLIGPLGMIILLDAGRRVMNHALARPARETLFTVLPRDEKYKAKAAVDTFVYRGGDAAAAGVWKLVGALGLGGAAVALAALPLAMVWGGVAIALGVMQASRANDTAPTAAMPATPGAVS